MPVGALRGLTVLETISGMAQPVSLAAVSAACGLSQTQAFRTLQALEREEYLVHVGRSGYRLGGRALALASLVGPRPALRRLVHPVISRLATTTGLAAGMSVRSGGHRVLVVSTPGESEDLRGAFATGERSPLTVGSAGRVIGAYLPPEEIPDELRDAAAGIRAQGYAASFAENHAGLNAMAVALLDPDTGTPLGSLVVAGRDVVLTTTRMARCLPVLQGAAAALAPRLSVMIGPGASAGIDPLDL